jgi:hypothetical protein
LSLTIDPLKDRYALEVSMSRWLIDDFGNIAPAGPAALAKVLGLTHPASTEAAGRLEAYAILNVGLVAIEKTATAVAIKCRPAVMSERAVSTLSYWLLDHASLPVSITWFDQFWDVERAPDARAALSLISYLLELKRPASSRPSERICVQPSVQAVRRWQHMKPRVAPLTAGPLDIARCAQVLDPLFFGRWALMEVDKAAGKIDVLGLGGGYPLIDPVFAPTDARRPLETLADTEYRTWITDSFLDVARSQRARFEDIDAVVMWPRFGDLRTRYWRILTPLRQTAGSCTVLSASGNDSGIDLRPKHV